MSTNNNQSEKADLGCIILIAFIVAPFVLTYLFVALIPYIIVGMLGFTLWQVYVYNERTGNITRYFEEKYNLVKDAINEAENEYKLEDDKISGLPNEKENELENLRKKVESLELENRQEREKRQKDIKEALYQYRTDIKQNQKKQVLNDIFGDSPKSYARSDEFEKQDFEKYTQKKKDELEIRELKVEVNEQLFAQERKITEGLDNAKSERFEIRMELRDGFANVDTRFMKIEGEFADYRAYVSEKFSNLELHFLKEIGALKEFIGNVRLELKSENNEMKLQFGQEVLRLDKQQVQIVDRMQKYENQVKGFSIDMTKLKIEAERFAMRGEDVLNKANTIYQRHKADMHVAGSELKMGLQKMAVKNEAFSNTVASAQLRLDEISKEQYFALKDMAHERIGINMLRQDYDQRQAVENEKAQKLLAETRHIEDRIKERISRGQEVGALNHQLHVTRENLAFTSHRADLMRQESSMVRRLSR